MSQEVIAGCIMSIIGLVLSIAPVFIWKIAEKWKFTGDSRPSASYLNVIRAVGCIFAFAGAFLVFGLIK